MNHRIVLERKSTDIKPSAITLGSGKSYSPSFSKEDITYADVVETDLDELLKLAGKAYGVSNAWVSNDGVEEREVSIG